MSGIESWGDLNIISPKNMKSFEKRMKKHKKNPRFLLIIKKFFKKEQQKNIKSREECNL